MTIFTNEFLKKCEALKDHRDLFPPRIGSLISRGFADLGFELFSVLPNDKILSLFTGQLSGLNASDTNHFFPVPTVDEFARKIYELGFLMVSKQLDDSTFQVKIRNSEGVVVAEARSRSLLECMMHVFLSAIVEK